MREIIAFLIRHGYAVLFVWVLLEQLGLPLPSFPMLLAAGTLAGSGRLNLGAALLATTIGALLSDGFWYVFGWLRGNTVLRWVCKISLEPDSCVRRTEDIYLKYGAKSLLAAKFVPGFGAVAAPLAELREKANPCASLCVAGKDSDSEELTKRGNSADAGTAGRNVERLPCELASQPVAVSIR